MTRRDLLLLSAAAPSLWARTAVRLCGLPFRRIQHAGSGWRFLHIHGDEPTARQVLAERMQAGPGRALFIESETRLVPWMGGRLDPNRLFSNEGADRNLHRFNPRWSEAQVSSAVTRLSQQRHELINQLLPRDGGVLVALHNNGGGYNVDNEVPISDRVSLRAPDAKSEFLLVTDPRDFAKLAAAEVNVVLQNRTPRDDDGSLSRLAARLGFRYVNIEAMNGHYAEQKKLLQFVEETLR
jgi:hypothetical protein